MESAINRRLMLALSASASVMIAAGAAHAAAESPATIDELVVTAQRRSEALQDVPIAVSAFSQASLEARHIDGGANLEQAIPNVSFSKGYYAGYNFQIRGIGTKQNSATGDTSTGVHLNGVPLTENRLFEAEFFDVERVEVLRGPQGTLYGRNATGGVVNVITAKPEDTFEADIRAELGNYEGRKLRAMVNLPLMGDVLALRVAGSYVYHSGFSTNSFTGDDIDGRNLYSVRATLGFNPTATFHSSLMWQHFREDDNRLNTSKSFCVRDNGPASVAGVAVTDPLLRGFLSQGCKNGSIYSDAAFGTPNSLATLYGIFALRAGLATGDVNAGKTQSHDLSVTESSFDPHYKAGDDVYVLSADWDVASHLQLNWLTSYYEGTYDAAQDNQGFQPSVPFVPTALYPTGTVNDPQLGPSKFLTTYNSNLHPSKQFTQEIRLQSSFKGPLNFSLGGNYLIYKTTQDNYTLSDAFTAYSNFANGGVPCALGGSCIYIAPTSDPTVAGHNYYLSHSPYTLKSGAAFGELYWQVTDTVKVTGGLRYTDDRKLLFSYPATLFTKGAGVNLGTPASFATHFGEFTGRLGVDWKPELSFTDKTLVYAFYSRGYKGGGPNNATGVGILPFYAPEFVNAYEVGTKNTLLDGRVTLNLTGFYYDYKGYQISKTVNRTTTVENIDASIKGLEAEARWAPVDHLQLDMNLGLLDSKATGGASIDSENRNQGNAAYTLVKTSGAGACLIPTAPLANLLAIIQQQPGAPVIAGVSGNPLALLNACSGTYASMGLVVNNGFDAQLKGKELPNSAPWTVSLGAQYDHELPGGWSLMLRGDYYRQGPSFSRIFNDEIDRIRAWDNVNFTLRLSKPESQLAVEAYVKNAFDKRSVVNLFIFDDATGTNQNGYILDPRTFGVAVSKHF